MLAVGALALAGGIAFMMCGFNEEGVAGQTPRIPANAETGVKPVDMELLSYMLRITKEPFKLPVISDKTGSFLASDRRVYCAECAAPIPSDVKICVECGKSQPEEAKVVYDTDNDGLPDEWEKRFGLNINDPADADLDTDGDLFTNREEYEMGTNPTDPKSHPPYSNYLSLQPPLKETKLPFYFDSVSKLPSGYRFQFIDPAKVNPETRRKGVIYRPLLDEDIGDTGFVAKSLRGQERKAQDRRRQRHDQNHRRFGGQGGAQVGWQRNRVDGRRPQIAVGRHYGHYRVRTGRAPGVQRGRGRFHRPQRRELPRPVYTKRG